MTAADNRLFAGRCCTVIVPECHGVICRGGSATWTKVHLRFSRCVKSGVWEQVFEHFAADADNEYAMIDSTIVRAHQHSAGAKRC